MNDRKILNPCFYTEKHDFHNMLFNNFFLKLRFEITKKILNELK